MAVIENHEPMVSINLDGSKLILDYDVDLGYTNEFVARKSVVDKLKQASLLLPEGLYLLVKEAHRPRSFQSFIYNRRVIKLLCSEEFKRLSSTQIHRLASEYIAPPNVAGHPTGGAVDVSLINKQGVELDLGCNYDDDATTSNGKCYSFFEDLPDNVKMNRKILFSCMESAGFINYPFEWWHWSYGDKYWAAVKGSSHSLYSAIDSK
ncbi:M15 family metallopeptidase [Vibrio sp. WXL103]|uniref:M15 family metallopeptidase n=1 Tax=Vibrio sp. WXL103 TaxID=3450710 RepID=UPI003EC61EDE